MEMNCMNRKNSPLLNAFLMFLTVCVILTGCGGGGEAPAATSTDAETTAETTAQQSDTAAETTAPPDINQPQTVNYLTGLPLAQGEQANIRACAVIINNLSPVVKYQTGLSFADVIYEYEVEGGITRLLAVFRNPENISQIGSIRSARAVSLNIAMGLDAFYIHAGGSNEAYSMLSSASYTHIDGISDSGTFFRVAAVSSNVGYEHSMFTSSSRLTTKLTALKNAGTRTALKSGYETPFSFYDDDTSPAGTAAVKVTTKYGSYQPYFKYDSGMGLYTRREYNALHIDSLNGKALAFKNVIVLAVPSTLSGDSSGHRNFRDVGSGTGVYVTNGVSVQITWSKASGNAPLKLYAADGSALKINKGKTFVSYVNGTDNITVSAS